MRRSFDEMRGHRRATRGRTGASSLAELNDFAFRVVAVRALEGALIVPRRCRLYASKHHRRSTLRAGRPRDCARRCVRGK
jgi:hypothetical protein